MSDTATSRGQVLAASDWGVPAACRRRFLSAAWAMLGGALVPENPARAQVPGGRARHGPVRSGFDLGPVGVGATLDAVAPELARIERLDVGVQMPLSPVVIDFDPLMFSDLVVRAVRFTQRVIERNEYFLAGAAIYVDTYAPGRFAEDKMARLRNGRPLEVIRELSPVLHPVHKITIVAHVGGLGLATDHVLALATRQFGQPAWRIDQPHSSVGVARAHRDRLVIDPQRRTDKVTLAWGGLRRPSSVQQGVTFNSFDDVLLGLAVSPSQLPGDRPGQRLQVIGQEGQALGIMIDYLDIATACLPPSRRGRA